MKNLYLHSGSLAFCLLLLASCGETPEVSPPVTVSAEKREEKAPFIVETLILGTETWATKVEKSARIVASSNLVLTTQSAGEISKILIKEWQVVKAGTSIISIKDSLTNLDLRLDQAENSVNIQKASLETTAANLEIAVQSARIWYERAKQWYESLLSKNNITYDALVKNNRRTLDAYNGSFASYLADLDRTLTQTLYEGDKILGISPDFDAASDWWDAYLWIRVWNARSLAVNAWNNAYRVRGLVRSKIEQWASFDGNNPTFDLALLSDSFDVIRKYVDTMIYMLQNDVVGWWLPQTLQDTWILTWNGFRAQTQWSETQFNAWKSQVITFLKSFNEDEKATQIALSSLSRSLSPEEVSMLASNQSMNISYKLAKLDLDNAIKNAKLSLEQADVSYINTRTLRDATIRQLLAAKQSAEIWLEQAKRDYGKLRVNAPVEWTITKILTSIGQTVWIWTPVVEIAGKDPEIILDIESSLARTLNTGDSVSISIDKNNFTWSITAVSKISGWNLLSSLRIGAPSAVKYIGSTATVTLIRNPSMWSGSTTIPLDAIKIIAEWEWEIAIINASGWLEKKTVTLGKIEWNRAEITSELAKWIKLIITDMTNYDSLRHTIVVQ